MTYTEPDSEHYPRSLTISDGIQLSRRQIFSRRFLREGSARWHLQDVARSTAIYRGTCQRKLIARVARDAFAHV